MRRILLILIILICIGGIVGAAYTYNNFSESLTTDETEEPTEEPTEDPSTCKHNNEVVLPAVEATCYKNGYTEGRICTACGTTLIEQEVIDKLAHTPEIIPSEASTCMVPGHSAGSKCSVCHEVLVIPEELPLGDHTPITISAQPATCISYGTTSYIMCSECLFFITEPEYLPYGECDFSVYVEATEPTCKEEGHSAYYSCYYCGTADGTVEYLGFAEHNLVETAKGAPASCTMIGFSSEYTCTECNEVIIPMMTIPMLDHYCTDVPGKASTCTEAGYTESLICTMCNEYIDFWPQPLPLAPHTIVTLSGKAATCTSDGLTDGETCSVCGTITVPQETIAKLGHNYVALPTLVADCGNNGRSGGTECTRCGSLGESPTFTPALGHYFGDNFENPCDRCNGYLSNSNELGFTKQATGEYAVTSIGTFSSITMIIPNTYSNTVVTQIANGAISSPKVETILVGSNIRSIELNAFKNCTKLKSIFIPDNVLYVSAAAIVGCTQLTDVYVQFREGYLPESWNENWAMGLPEGCTIHYLSEDAVTYGFKYSLNADGESYSVTGIDYKNTTDYSFVIPAKHNGLPVTAIANGAFDKVYGIEEMQIPNSVTTIGDSAFEFCYDLKKVIFAGNVKLGARAFASCSKLETVNTVKVIEMGEYCFLSTALKVVELSPNLTVVPRYAFDSCESLKSVFMNEGTKKILDQAFYNCTALTNIYLPDGLEHISMSVFARCHSLESIYIPETVTKMGINEAGSGRGMVFYTTGELVINCGADSQPSGWYDGWNVSETDPDTDEILGRYTTNWGQAR